MKLQRRQGTYPLQVLKITVELISLFFAFKYEGEDVVIQNAGISYPKPRAPDGVLFVQI